MHSVNIFVLSMTEVYLTFPRHYHILSCYGHFYKKINLTAWDGLFKGAFIKYLYFIKQLKSI